MSDSKHSPPDELYRAYQETRDNIPPRSLAIIRAAAEAQAAEDNIQSILQQAKPIHAQSENQTFTHSTAQKSSWLHRIGHGLFGNIASVAASAHDN